ncbi:hypothetical protein [Escherichia coli]|uniref:hypothetical protein n=1 Tax=Escherichia coli TaxID=562 RepID=UPI00190001A7|nr:hypothetical protein [Escherichia coli]
MATVRAVHAAGADTGKNGRKLPLRAAGYFRIPFVINTYKPEDQLFVSGIHKEGNIQVCAALNGSSKLSKCFRHPQRRNIQVCAALNGIVKIIKELLRLLRQRSHRREASRHSGEVCFFEGQVFVYGV